MRATSFVLLLCSFFADVTSAMGQNTDEPAQLGLQAWQLFEAGKYSEALALQRTVAADIEKLEIARSGSPAKETTDALISVSWYALFARAPAEALTASDRAHALAPRSLVIETNRAHALLFLGREGEASKLYSLYKGKRLSPDSGKTWEDGIVEDFDALRAAGIVHDAFPKIVAQLGVKHPELNASIEATHKLLDKLHEAGKHQDPETVALAEKLVDLTRRRYGEGRAEFGMALSSLAATKVVMEDAEAIYRRSLAIVEKALGPEHPQVATILTNLGSLYRFAGYPNKAEPLFKRSIAIVEKAFGPDHLQSAWPLAELAKVYGADKAKSLQLVTRSLAIREKAVRPYDPNAAKLLKEIGADYSDQNLLAQAKSVLKRSLAIAERTLDPQHPEIAAVLYSLAQLYKRQDRIAETEPLLRRSLAIRETALGLEDIAVEPILKDLAKLYEVPRAYRRSRAASYAQSRDP